MKFCRFKKNSDHFVRFSHHNVHSYFGHETYVINIGSNGFVLLVVNGLFWDCKLFRRSFWRRRKLNSYSTENGDCKGCYHGNASVLIGVLEDISAGLNFPQVDLVFVVQVVGRQVVVFRHRKCVQLENSFLVFKLTELFKQTLICDWLQFWNT